LGSLLGFRNPVVYLYELGLYSANFAPNGERMAATVQGSATAVKQQESSTCPTCGETIARQFCPDCGEQKFDRHSFSFRHFVRHAAHELLELDSKVLRTVRYLFSKPGFVTAGYLAGKRNRYVNPFRLYVLCFALSTWLTSTYHPVLDFKNIANAERTGKLNRMLEKFAQYKGLSEEALLLHLNERLHSYYEVSKIFDALVMACLLAIFYRKQKWYFGEHAVTSFYFLSFTLLLTMVKWPLWLALGAPVQSASAYILSLIFLLIALPYLWVTLRKLHGEGPWKTAAKSVLVYGGTQLTIIVTTILSFGLAILHTVLVR
jgi:predicted RNA-binding Zn-ribbon protein involved in translation (DUF1610 family)